MKRNAFGTVLWCLALLISLTGSGWSALPPTATEPSGSGTSGDPYQIASLANLYWIAAPDAVVSSPSKATRWAAYYIQTADINAAATSG